MQYGIGVKFGLQQYRPSTPKTAAHLIPKTAALVPGFPQWGQHPQTTNKKKLPDNITYIKSYPVLYYIKAFFTFDLVPYCTILKFFSLLISCLSTYSFQLLYFSYITRTFISIVLLLRVLSFSTVLFSLCKSQKNVYMKSL